MRLLQDKIKAFKVGQWVFFIIQGLTMYLFQKENLHYHAIYR